MRISAEVAPVVSIHTSLLVVFLKQLERAHNGLVVEPEFVTKLLHVEILVELIVVDQGQVNLLLAVSVGAELAELTLCSFVGAFGAKARFIPIVAEELLNGRK